MKQATQSRSKAVSQPDTGIKEPVEWDAFASLPAPDSPQQNWDAFGEGVQSSTKIEEPQAARSGFDMWWLSLLCFLSSGCSLVFVHFSG